MPSTSTSGENHLSLIQRDPRAPITHQVSVSFSSSDQASHTYHCCLGSKLSIKGFSYRFHHCHTNTASKQMHKYGRPRTMIFRLQICSEIKATGSGFDPGFPSCLFTHTHLRFHYTEEQSCFQDLLPFQQRKVK